MSQNSIKKFEYKIGIRKDQHSNDENDYNHINRNPGYSFQRPSLNLNNKNPLKAPTNNEIEDKFQKNYLNNEKRVARSAHPIRIKKEKIYKGKKKV